MGPPSKGPMHAPLHSVPPTLQQATVDLLLCQGLLDNHGQVWSVSCGVTAPFSWVLVHTRFHLSLQESVSPVLYKFWQLNGGVIGNLFQEGLCHTQVCCSQSAYLCGSPLLTCASTGNTQTQFCLSLCGVSVSSTGLRETDSSLRGHKQNLVCTKTQKKGAVIPQETQLKLPASVGGSPVEHGSAGAYNRDGGWGLETTVWLVPLWHKSSWRSPLT